MGLLRRAHQGDREALNELCARQLPRLRRWTHGRLPRNARDLLNSDDLIQDALLRTLERFDTFEDRGEGALQAYLRQIILNRIRDEARRAQRRPHEVATRGDEPALGPSPLEQTIGRDTVDRYEAALMRLRPMEREAILLRIEQDYDYDQVAEAMGKSSAGAARMMVGRALLRLAEEMDHEG